MSCARPSFPFLPIRKSFLQIQKPFFIIMARAESSEVLDAERLTVITSLPYYKHNILYGRASWNCDKTVSGFYLRTFFG